MINSRQDRKTKSYSDTFWYKGVDYPVNAKKSGIYIEIMLKMIEQLDIARLIHKRVLVIRFDLHSYNFSDSNKEISLFRKQITQWIERNYGTHAVGFVWVRELERAKQQHYHCAIFIDGDKIRHSKKLLEVIKEKWEMAHSSNHMPVIEKPYYFVDNDEMFAKAVYRLSYLAKTRGKRHRPEQVKDYATSRLKIPA